MIKRKLDGADWKIRKLDATVHDLWKIWKPTPSGTWSYGRQAGKQAGWWNLGKA